MKKVLIIMAFICMAFSVNAQNKYAVLITGDYAAKNVPEQDRWKSDSNGGVTNAPMQEFWNDTYLMWELLQANGYSRENIFVLFADGVDYPSQCPRYQVPEGVIVTDFAATVANVTNVFTGFRYGTNGMPQLTENDFLFVWVFDHGGFSNGHSYFCLIDGNMSDSQFAALLDPLPVHRKAFWMQQCHSGGFMDDLSSNNSVFIAACQYNQSAYPADDRTKYGTSIIENENCEENIAIHGEFNFHMFSAVNGESPSGEIHYDDTLYISADNNINDGFISMQEAYAWMAHRDSNYEIPVYDDIGGIGSNVCLQYPTLLYGIPLYSEIHRGIIGVSSDFTVCNGQTVTFTGISDVTLCNNATFTVEDGGTLIIDGQVTFNGTNDNSLIIKGNFIQNNGSELQFHNMKVEGNALHLSIDNARFYNTELVYVPQLSTIASTPSIGDLTVINCTFDNPTKNVAIDVRNCLKYKLIGDTIKASNHHGIKLTRCGSSVSSNSGGRVDMRVYGNDISGCVGTGLRMYASTGEVLMNQIHNNGRGVELLNKCNINEFKGDCSAFVGDDTQHIYNNTSYEIYMTSACDPLLTRYNLIEKTLLGTTPYVYYDGLVDFGEVPIIPSDRGIVDFCLNAWGNTGVFNPAQHLYSNVPTTSIVYGPQWIMGDCSDGLTAEQNLVLQADSLCEEGEYVAAKALYMQVVEEYPNTTSAEIALKDLLPLEALIEDDYAALKTYYLTNTAIVSNEVLNHLANAMANRCDEVMGNYVDAIAWYEDLIVNPDTPIADSIFATIDLGNLYLAMENNGIKTKGKLAQYKPESIELYLINCEKALSLLPIERNKDPWPHYIEEYPLWIDSVTVKPNGFVMDANGNVEISTPEGLAWLISAVNGLNGCEPDNFDGRTVRLTCDIDLDAGAHRRFSPIGSREHPFMGTFDGGGHTIDGLYVAYNSPEYDPAFDIGMFGCLKHGTVKDFVVNSGLFVTSHHLNGGEFFNGCLVGISDSLSVVDGCIVKIRAGGDDQFGSIVGLNRNSVVRNCAYCYGDNDYLVSRNGGGIVYHNLSEGGYADAEVVNCFFYGSVKGSYSAQSFGGIVCFNESDSRGGKAVVKNCFAEVLSGLNGFMEYKGSVVGCNMKGCVVENCYGHIWNNYGQAGLFGDNQGLAMECAEFVPTGPCQLETSVMVGSTSTNIMVDALNTWVDMQESPSLYKAWEVNEDYGIPMFADGITVVDKLECGTEALAVYPNPTTGFVHLEGMEVTQVQLFNTLGQKIKTVLGTNEINVEGLPQGIYILRVMATEGTIQVARVVVNDK